MDVTSVSIGSRQWTLGEQIGSGGFGRVFAATSEGDEAVIKLVPKDAGAGRELLLADDLRGVPNVVPVIGTGETTDDWALLMPYADTSLRSCLIENGRPFEQAEAVPILMDIARALVSLAAKRVVHRDLKPENILLLDGVWCLADFGISRYALAVTASDTRKYSTTRTYMAPEQWRDETATGATDVYAFGLIAHELLMGASPFNGPDFRHEHLHEDPPVVIGVAPPLAGLIEESLFKAPGARPAASNLLARLEKQAMALPSIGGIFALQDADRAQITRGAQSARLRSQDRTASEDRSALLDAAGRQLRHISRELEDAISSATTSLRETDLSGVMDTDVPAWELSLGPASLLFAGQRTTSPERARASGLPFDVIAYSRIAVEGAPNHGYAGREHSLWFCDAHEAGSYRWYECGFNDNFPYGFEPSGFERYGYKGRLFEPYALDPDKKASEALLNTVRYSFNREPYYLALPFTMLLAHELEDFIDRWAGWFAEASRGEIERPTGLELDLAWSWRRDDLAGIQQLTPLPRRINQRASTGKWRFWTPRRER